jgi:serine/threonine protein kinase
VEDDGECGLFPCNSCGTAAYVAPEAFGKMRRVSNSVDVYAFGILMWELLAAKVPYGNMPVKSVVNEVGAAVAGAADELPHSQAHQDSAVHVQMD